MSHGSSVREELRVPTRQLRHAIPQVYAGYKELHDSALAPGTLDVKTKELIALAIAVSKIIDQARHPAGPGADVICEAAEVVAERAAFWRPLAEDTERPMVVDLAAGHFAVRVSHEDLATCADILLENVFAHTPDGAGCVIRLSRREPGGAWLVVTDDGPGFPSADPTERGRSGVGSTGLGLDIARRIAESSGGTLTIGRSASGGGVVTVGLGPPNAAILR